MDVPARSDPEITEPEDRNSTIWRYMDLAKFVAMLEYRGLYFSRAHLLGDKFEGSYPKANRPLRAALIARLRAESPEQALASLPDKFEQIRRWLPQWFLVNCWHMNDGESAAMWRLYARSSEAVAVRSTFQKLWDALDESYNVGLVRYIDYDRQMINEDSLKVSFLHKRLSFEHEREIRAIRMDHLPTVSAIDVGAENPGTSEGKDIRKPESRACNLSAKAVDGGILQPVDLDAVVEAVFVAPSAPRWFAELVGRLAKRFGLDAPVHQSRLDDEPFS